MCCSTFVQEVKPREVDELGAARRLLCTEEDRGSEDSLETLDQAPVVRAILGEAKEVEQSGGRIEVNRSALLLQSESGDPDGNQTVLAEGDGRFIMHLPQ